eukprot:2563-Heterococcus_DN1.PRE.2
MRCWHSDAPMVAPATTAAHTDRAGSACAKPTESQHISLRTCELLCKIVDSHLALVLCTAIVATQQMAVNLLHDTAVMPELKVRRHDSACTRESELQSISSIADTVDAYSTYLLMRDESTYSLASHCLHIEVHAGCVT